MGLGMLGAALAAGISGAGEGAVQGATEQMKEDARVNEIKVMQEAEQAKMLAIAHDTRQQAEEQANRLRTEQTGRIQAAQETVADKAITGKYAQSDAAVNAANTGQTDAPLTPEQQAAIDQSKQQDKTALMGTKDNFVKAGILTGDITPHDVLAASDKEDAARMRQESFMDRTQMLGIIQDTKAAASKDRGDMMMAIAQLKVDNATDKNSGTALTKNVAMLKGLGYSEDDIKNFIFEKKGTSLDDLATKLYSSDTNFGSKHITVEQAVDAAVKMKQQIQAVTGGATPKGVPNPTLPAFDPAAFMKK